MKVIATILLFYFSFLSAQPLLPLIQSQLSKEGKCTMSCCQKHKKVNHKGPVGNCCGGMMCNPFGQYSCCIGYVVEKEVSVSFVKETAFNQLSEINRSLIQRNCTDCWRPPESIVS